MRGDDTARMLDKGAIGRGLIGEDVEGGTLDAACAIARDALVQCVEERFFVDDGAAGGVDKEGAWLHDLEFMGADEIFGLRDKRAVQAHHVGYGE